MMADLPSNLKKNNENFIIPFKDMNNNLCNSSENVTFQCLKLYSNLHSHSVFHESRLFVFKIIFHD